MNALGKCPVCGHPLKVTKLQCNSCSTTIGGEFTLCNFCKLSPEQKKFIETFIKCRGNIKEVEKDLGISYPTVRSKLDDVITTLGYTVAKSDHENEENKKEILNLLSQGKISYEEALKLLKNIE